jgi:hypothetical protein
MQFRFYDVGDKGTLNLIDEWDVEGDFSAAKREVEQHFDALVGKLRLHQVLVFSSGLGQAPGLFVAVETIYMAHLSGRVRPDQQVRSLVWLVEDAIPKH